MSSSNKLITDKEFNNIDIWETEEGRMKALLYIFTEYTNSSDYKGIKRPTKLDKDNFSLFENTLFYSNDFRRFACDNYRVGLEYYDEEDEVSILKF
jgi:hypothetical protein